MALANPEASIISVESDPIFASHLNNQFKRFGITNAHLLLADLKDQEGGAWYDYETTGHYDLAVLDGPNRQLGNRSLAFTLIDEALKGATVIIDDADDPALLDSFTQWAEQSGRSVSTLGIREKNTAISKAAA
jgi:predicted O-methyltransferase YrrM